MCAVPTRSGPARWPPPRGRRRALRYLSQSRGSSENSAPALPPNASANPSLRRIYSRLREQANVVVQPADVFALFSDDGDVSATLASIAGAERSSIVRFGRHREPARAVRTDDRAFCSGRSPTAIPRARRADERIVRGGPAGAAGIAGRTQRAACSENERMTPSPAYRNGDVQYKRSRIKRKGGEEKDGT